MGLPDKKINPCLHYFRICSSLVLELNSLPSDVDIKNLTPTASTNVTLSGAGGGASTSAGAGVVSSDPQYQLHSSNNLAAGAGSFPVSGASAAVATGAATAASDNSPKTHSALPSVKENNGAPHPLAVSTA